MFHTYAIWNKIRDKIYIGYTADLNDRMKRHNGLSPNRIKSFTYKNSGRWQLVHSETFKMRSEAIHREKELKTARGRKFVKEIMKKL